LAETDSKTKYVKKRQHMCDINVRLIVAPDLILSLKLRGKVEMITIKEEYN